MIPIRYFLFLLLFISTMGNAQIKKGDILLDLNANATLASNPQYRSGHSYQLANLSPRFGYMINDKMMAGAGLSSSHYSNSTVFGGDYKSTSFVVSPFVRYYFLNESKWNPYFFLESRFGKSRIDTSDPSFDEERTIAGVAGGIGLNYFLSENISLDATIGTNVWRTLNAGGLEYTTLFDVGIQTYINHWDPFEGSLYDKYLCKGNFTLSGGGYFRIEDNPRYGPDSIGPINANLQTVRFAANPQIGFFVKDRIKLTFATEIESSANGNARFINLGGIWGVEAYSPFNTKEQLFFVPSFHVGYFWNFYEQHFSFPVTIFTSPGAGGLTTTTEAVKHTNSSFHFKANLGCAFKYFTDASAVYTLGANYQFGRASGINALAVSDSQWRLYGELEYFFKKNLSISTRLSYESYVGYLESNAVFASSYNRGYKYMNGSFTLNYYFFSSSCYGAEKG